MKVLVVVLSVTVVVLGGALVLALAGPSGGCKVWRTNYRTMYSQGYPYQAPAGQTCVEK